MISPDYINEPNGSNVFCAMGEVGLLGSGKG